MLIKSIYQYKAPFPGSLPCEPNEVFLKIREENEHWFLVSKADGSIGCVPGSYMKTAEGQNDKTITNWARKSLNWLNNCSPQMKDHKTILRILSDLASTADENVAPNRPSGKSPPIVVKDVPFSVRNPEQDIQRSQAPTVHGSVLTTQPVKPLHVALSDGLASRLVDVLRLGTNAGYSDCRDTLRVFLEILASGLPNVRPYSEALERMLMSSNEKQHTSAYFRSPDWYLLKHYFGNFGKREADSQEGSWKLHEDSVELEKNLDELYELLTKANPSLVQHFLIYSDHKPLQCLIRLYQRESRPQLRRKLLLAIGSSCTMDSTCMEVATSSVLPLEIIRELSSSTDQSEVSHISASLRLLTVLFAHSLRLPVDVQDKLDPTFFTKILKLIGPVEDGGHSEELIDLGSPVKNGRSSLSDQPLFAGQLSCAATALLLACNWHFCSRAAKRMHSTVVPLLSALKAHPTACQRFLELVIQAFNRGFDPIFHIEFTKKAQSRHFDRLLSWAELISDHPTSAVENGVEPFPNSAVQSLLQFEDHATSRLVEADDGGYARVLWSAETMRAQSKRKSTVVLPASVAPTTPRHSVLKLIFDLYSSVDAANLVYDSDQDLIVEVINRHLRDLNVEEDEHLLEYPILLGLVIANSNYLSRGAYRGSELIQSLESFLNSDLYKPTPDAYRRSAELARISLDRLRSALAN